MRGSRTGRPIMAALDLLGRRWALRVLWELRDGEPASFRELRRRCDQMSTSVLNQRLTELRDAGVVETGPQGYRLTETGAELLKALAPLDAWAKRWGAADAGAQARRGRGSRGNPPQGAERPPPPEGAANP